MAYTIIRSDNSTVLTTIQDGAVNTTSTSLGLPGRNYAGYGQIQDTNFVRMLENFASANPPANPLKGQLWFNTSNPNQPVLCVCPADGTTVASQWIKLTSATSAGATTLGNVTITGDIVSANNATITNNLITSTLAVATVTVSSAITSNIATITTANVTSVLNARYISTGSQTNPGNIQGAWTVNGNPSGNALSIINGNVSFTASSTNGIKCDNYMYANGAPFNPSGTYNNGNVSDYLTGANNVTQFNGNITPNNLSSNTISTLSGTGTISGIWTLTTGARINATYADLAERFEADDIYDAGTVVEIGGDKEITAVTKDASEEVFGVVSTTAGFTMNGAAGSDETHPSVAVSGRVLVKVIGKVKKGQRLVSAGIKGYARAAKKEELTAFNVIGRALENKTDAATGMVLAVVSITK